MPAEDKQSCFIIMPITTAPEQVDLYGGDADHFAHVLKVLFIPAVEQAGFRPIPPITEGADVIQASIIRNLEEADLVLCDVSTLNPNVFFELGIRTALNKPASLVRDELTRDVPFDTGVINHHEYSSTLKAWELESEVRKLAIHIKQSAEPGTGTSANKLWSYFGLSTRASRAEDGGQQGDQLAYLTVQVEALRNEISDLGPRAQKSAEARLRFLESLGFNSAKKLLEEFSEKHHGVVLSWHRLPGDDRRVRVNIRGQEQPPDDAVEELAAELGAMGFVVQIERNGID